MFDCVIVAKCQSNVLLSIYINIESHWFNTVSLAKNEFETNPITNENLNVDEVS